jgi:hypothetical protein
MQQQGTQRKLAPEHSTHTPTQKRLDMLLVLVYQELAYLARPAHQEVDQPGSLQARQAFGSVH